MGPIGIGGGKEELGRQGNRTADNGPISPKLSESEDFLVRIGFKDSQTRVLKHS